MKKRRNIGICVIAAAVMICFCFGVQTDSAFAKATSKPGKTTIKISKKNKTSVKIRWNKARNANCYRVYINGKAVKTTALTWATVKNLKAGKTYKVKVRPMKVFKTRKYYSKKTHKWTYKKPPAKYIKKSKKVTRTVYGKFSNAIIFSPKAVSVKAPDTNEKLNEPSTVTVTSTEKGLKVTASAVAGADGYSFYKVIGNETVLYKEQKSRTMLDTSVDAGKLQKYNVCAYKIVNGKKVRGYVTWGKGTWEKPEGSSSSQQVQTPTTIVTQTSQPSTQTPSTSEEQSSGQPSGDDSADPRFAAAKMENKTFTLYMDENCYIVYTLDSNMRITSWTSDNPSVATVKRSGQKEGTVTCLSDGTARITAHNWNGDTKTATVTVKTAKPKYSYRLFKMKGQDIYAYDKGIITPYAAKYLNNKTSEIGRGVDNYFVILTDNPSLKGGYEQGDTLCFYDIDKKETVGPVVQYLKKCTLEFPAKPSSVYDGQSAEDFRLMPDRLPSGEYVYVYRLEFKGSGPYRLKIMEAERTDNTLKNRVMANGIWTINTKSTFQSYMDWLYESIDRYTTSSMNKHEKMLAITNGLKNKATYDCNPSFDEYNYNTSMRIRSMPYWESYYWDSSFTLPMQDIGALLDYRVLNCNEADKPSRLHGYTFGTFNGTEYRYGLEPAAYNPLLTDYCPQLQMKDFEEIPKGN